MLVQLWVKGYVHTGILLHCVCSVAMVTQCEICQMVCLTLHQIMFFWVLVFTDRRTCERHMEKWRESMMMMLSQLCNIVKFVLCFYYFPNESLTCVHVTESPQVHVCVSYLVFLCQHLHPIVHDDSSIVLTKASQRLSSHQHLPIPVWYQDGHRPLETSHARELLNFWGTHTHTRRLLTLIIGFIGSYKILGCW